MAMAVAVLLLHALLPGCKTLRPNSPESVVQQASSGTNLGTRSAAERERRGSLQWNESWYEVPRDVLTAASGGPAPEGGLDDWLAEREWRYFKSHVGRPGARSTKDVSMAYVTIRSGGTKGALMVVVGSAEFIRMYAETLYDLMVMGYSPIYAYAHRGFGESDRLIPNHGPMYVEHQEDYIHDLRQITELAVAEMAGNEHDKDKPLFMICYSLGGAIATNFFMEEYEAGRNTSYSAVVAVAPGLMGVSPFPQSIAMPLLDLFSFFGRGQKYIPGPIPTFEDWWATDKFVEYNLTSSFTREKRKTDLCQAYRHEAVGADDHEGLCNVGQTVSWAKEFYDLTRDGVDRFIASAGKAIPIPVLMLTAGPPDGDDGYVYNSKTVEFCETSANDCKLTNYPDARHGMLYEVDHLRNQIFAEMDVFFQNHMGPKNVTNEQVPGIANGKWCWRHRDCASRLCPPSFFFNFLPGRCAERLVYSANSFRAL